MISCLKLRCLAKKVRLPRATPAYASHFCNPGEAVRLTVEIVRIRYMYLMTEMRYVYCRNVPRAHATTPRVVFLFERALSFPLSHNKHRTSLFTLTGFDRRVKSSFSYQARFNPLVPFSLQLSEHSSRIQQQTFRAPGSSAF